MNSMPEQRSRDVLVAAAAVLAQEVPTTPAPSYPVCGVGLGWWDAAQVRVHARYHQAQAVLAAALARRQAAPDS